MRTYTEFVTNIEEWWPLKHLGVSHVKFQVKSKGKRRLYLSNLTEERHTVVQKGRSSDVSETFRGGFPYLRRQDRPPLPNSGLSRGGRRMRRPKS